MDNKKAIEELKSNKSAGGWGFMCGECPCTCDESCELFQALDLAIKALEKNNEMLEYLKACLSQSDELKEKHRNVDDDGLKEHHKRMAIIFEGMGEAYADLIDRFFKEDSENDK